MNTVQITPDELAPGSVVIGSLGNMVILTGGLAAQVTDALVVFSIAADGTVRLGTHTQEQLEAIAAVVQAGAIVNVDATRSTDGWIPVQVVNGWISGELLEEVEDD